MTCFDLSPIFVLALKIDIRNIIQRKKGLTLVCEPEEMKCIEDVRFANAVVVSLDTHQTGVNSFVLKCHLESVQILECSRTLKDFRNPVDFTFEVIVTLNSKTERSLGIDYTDNMHKMHNMDEGAYEVCVHSHETNFDISEIIRQEVLLQEPMIPIDPEADTQEWIEAEEEKEKVDPRWAALKKLKGEA